MSRLEVGGCRIISEGLTVNFQERGGRRWSALPFLSFFHRLHTIAAEDVYGLRCPNDGSAYRTNITAAVACFGGAERGRTAVAAICAANETRGGEVVAGDVDILYVIR